MSQWMNESRDRKQSLWAGLVILCRIHYLVWGMEWILRCIRQQAFIVAATVICFSIVKLMQSRTYRLAAARDQAQSRFLLLNLSILIRLWGPLNLVRSPVRYCSDYGLTVLPNKNQNFNFCDARACVRRETTSEIGILKKDTSEFTSSAYCRPINSTTTTCFDREDLSNCLFSLSADRLIFAFQFCFWSLISAVYHCYFLLSPSS